MANIIKIKNSSVVAKVPLVGDLAYGEIALNYADGKIYYKKSDNTIQSISGGVASVSGTAPIVSSGGATPAISIPVATTSVSGYLSSTDWNTFNGKQAALGFTPYNATNPSGYTTNTGTVTSVAALTLGTTGTDVTSTVATGTTTPVITLNLPTASASNRGALSSANWTTFNNKQAALGFTPENTANKGAANGYAPLDATSKISSTYLPSYVDDVLEYANLAALPATGETAKIYVTLDTNKTYRWSGSAYVEISASPGSTDAVTEGSTNLYFTNTRARAAISATQNLTYNSTTGVITGPVLSSYLTAEADTLATVTARGATTTASIGIGAASPTANLHVQNSTNATFFQPTGTWAAKIYQAADGLGQNGLVVANRWSADNSTAFEVGSLYGAGSVWSSYYKISGLGTHTWGSGAAGAVRMTLDTSGNVGIGTTSPSSWGNLVVRGTSAAGAIVSAIVNTSGTAGSQAVLSFDPGSNGFNVRDSQIRATNNGSNQTTLEFYTANASTPVECMRITNTGRVGIGVTAPSVSLDTIGPVYIRGANAAGALLSITPNVTSGANGVNIAASFITGGHGPLLFSTAAATRITLDTSGNVGIGATTTTGERLTVIPSANPTTYATAKQIAIGEITNNSAYRLSLGYALLSASVWTGIIDSTANTAGTTLSINPSGGYVGIGTTAPRNQVEIGNATANQTLRIGGIYSGPTSGYTAVGQETTRHQIVFSSWRDAQTDTIGAKIVAINLTNYGAPYYLVQKTDLAFFTSNATPATTDATTERMRIVANGNVLIGTTTDGGYKLQVNGSFAATTKSFVIDHPTKPGMQLCYGSLEGPENGVYVRGKLKGNRIELPEYWTKLVDPDSITVNLTAIGKSQDLYVEDIIDNVVHIGGDNINCFYIVYGERVDVEKLKVEYDYQD
jgi:hypothetical protein